MNVYDYLISRNVTRLCHFTKLRSLTQILNNHTGILSTNQINEDIKDSTDLQRFDGEIDYISCSIQYPNSWFLNKVKDRNKNDIFNEWIVMFIDLNILKLRNVKFSPCNAATRLGKYIFDDANEINLLFDNHVNYSRGLVRGSKMLRCCPTDDQAEMLIEYSIPVDYINGIAVLDTDMAKRVFAILKVIKADNIPIIISPDLINKDWSTMVRCGTSPVEVLYCPESEGSDE